jgi:hypothetical protein
LSVKYDDEDGREIGFEVIELCTEVKAVAALL